MTNAYLAVKDKNMSVRRAAQQYSVPETTLRQRVLGRVDPERDASGRFPVFLQEEESQLVEHLKAMASVGYGYTRAEVVRMASEYAVALKKRDEDNPFSLKWFHKFMGRWPTLEVKKPRSLSVARAKATSKETVSKYFSDLDKILIKYHLKDKPHHIYNVDEKGLQTEHSPPYVVGSKEGHAPAVTASRSAITTVIGCGNAMCTHVPPYFVFKGARMRSELLSGSTPGADGTVSDSGWSNSEIFQQYLDTHFQKYVQGRNSDEPILLLYDGHRSHITLPLIDWAKQHNIILFVLPAHTSHALQPLDLGCFGPFQKIYNAECHKYIRENPATTITRYNVAELACKAYSKALSPANLMASFKKSGIHPFDPSAVNSLQFVPAVPFTATTSSADQQCNEDAHESQESNTVSQSCDDVSAFFEIKQQPIRQKIEHASKPRKNLSDVVSGKPITESSTTESIQKYKTQGKKRKLSNNTSKEKSKQPSSQIKKVTKGKMLQNKKCPSPQPGPSKILLLSSSENTDTDSDPDIPEEDKCCVCHLFQPKEQQNCVSLVFTKWAQCTYRDCKHWTHLKYCCRQVVVRLNDEFTCPCHNKN